MTIDASRVECLILAQSFETYWAYYVQSSGQLFSEKCREAALQFLDSFEKLSQQDPSVKDPDLLGLGKASDLENIVQSLREWAESAKDYPYDQAFKSRGILFVFISGLKALLIQPMNLSIHLSVAMTSREKMYYENVTKWKGHLPKSILHGDLDDIIEQASNSRTIVVVADIRRSQDLMTYATASADFSKRMIDFVTKTRQSIERHHGVFDKFTGDGYLAYFNEVICRRVHSDYDHIRCFLGFIREHREFATEHFQEWSRNVKKLPSSEIGLAIGADLGIVEFHDLDYHLVAVGDSIVWASRMASAASANEVLVNNLLFSALEEDPMLQFKARKAKTKTGESFLARSLEFKQDA